MPFKAPRVCGCGRIVAAGDMCQCVRLRTQERNARHDAKRPSARERGYDSKWDKERAEYLRVNVKCVRPGCGAPSTVVNHKTPHRGDMKLFWRRSNWEAVCTPCHCGPIQRAERRNIAS